MVTIKGTKWYVDIISDKRHGRFGGELGGKAFYADIDDFQWINSGGRIDEASEICLILDALEANHENAFRFFFPFEKVSVLVSVLQSVPGLMGRLYRSGEEYFQWELPNGIVFNGSHNAKLHEWYVSVFYQNDGKEVQLMQLHPKEEEIFELLIDFQTGRKVFAAKTDIFGRKTPPKMYDKDKFDRMSDRKKVRYSVL